MASSSRINISPPGLQQALVNSSTAWTDALQTLFDKAQEWFPDVVWEILDENEDVTPEEVWAHKGIIYARAPPGFQARYFHFRPAPMASPSPYPMMSGSGTGTPAPGQSSYSLQLGVDFPSRSPSPGGMGMVYRGPSPAPSSNTMANGMMRLTAQANASLFRTELEYLYTGKGLGEAFEFLFDDTHKDSVVSHDTGGAEESRQDKLRKDLVFMWRSRLYSDVRIALDGNFVSTNHEPTTAVFSSHRFMLVARSPYFKAQFLTWGVKGSNAKKDRDTAITGGGKTGEPLTVNLPGPPFTPASLHFTLGFIYTGTLAFSHRTYDLDTAFAILRSGMYLQIDTLVDEITARIVQEMMHGLFHAFLDFGEYERVTGGKWGVGGCRCRQCARRAPRVLEFATGPDVGNTVLERGARRALVGLFGEGWCTPEFAGLEKKTREGLVKGVGKRTTSGNVWSLLWAANHALDRLENQHSRDGWSEISREMVLAVRRNVDKVVCEAVEEVFEVQEWVEMLEMDGGRFEDGERVMWCMDAVRRGLTDATAPMVYQVLVSAILLRPHPTERDQTILSHTSPVRALVEATRMDVVKSLKKRWLGARQEGAFEPLEDWALKELSHEIDVPVEDLLGGGPAPASNNPRASRALRVANKAPNNADDSASFMGSMHSTRQGSIAPTTPRLASDAASVRSVARSTMSSSSAVPGRTRKIITNTATSVKRDTRPDSKLTPTSSSASSLAPSFRSAAERHSGASQATSSSRRAAPPMPIVTVNGEEDEGTPRSSTASMHSVRSRASTSTVRKSKAGTDSGRGGDDAASVGQVRDSTASGVTESSEASSAFKTASEASEEGPSEPSAVPENEGLKPIAKTASSPAVKRTTTGKTTTHARRGSTSTLSTHSIRNSKTSNASASVPSTPVVPSGRRSVASSSTSIASSVRSGVGSRRVTPTTSNTESSAVRRGLAVQRSVSSASSRSARSTASTSTRNTTTSASPAAKRAASNASTTTGATTSRKVSADRSSMSSSVASSIRSKPSTASVRSKASTVSVTPSVRASAAEKGKGKALSGAAAATPKKTAAAQKKDDASDVSSLKRKSSADTIRESRALSGAPTPRLSSDTVDGYGPKGITLDIGIPCIITSRRAKFRALARYIGEVAGERGPWVGVEVPVGENWSEDRLEGRAWCDGSWGGIRYFDLGAGSEYDLDAETRARTRRFATGGTMSPVPGQGRKREGDVMSVSERTKRFRSESPAVSDVSVAESRGLFVRPQQVLYVVDAVGSDF